MTIKLFYPASYLSHKNHSFLLEQKVISFLEKSNIKIILTLDKNDFNIESRSIEFIGRIPHQICLKIIKNSSALLFLSSYESLGLPILEACINNKSIIIPQLKYSTELIGNTGYFLKYPLNHKNFFDVSNRFKEDFLRGNNHIAKLKSDVFSSAEIIKIFLEKLSL